MLLHERIKEIREIEGFTRQQLADAIDVDVKSIWNWENKLSDPRASQVLKIAEVFDVTTDYLFGRDY